MDIKYLNFDEICNCLPIDQNSRGILMKLRLFLINCYKMRGRGFFDDFSSEIPLIKLTLIRKLKI